MKLLSAYEVDTVFGMAGTMTVELYRGIARSGIRHVQCRNEQGASLMADGYARATGKPGVCTIIAGPGVTNAATGIAQAYCDSQPLLVLSGACVTRTHGKGWGAIHELNDQAAVTAGFTAFSAMVRYPEELPELIARAYAVFRGSRPRPVHLSLPRDVLPETVEADWKTRRVPSLPMPDPAAIEEAADRLAQAKRPLILVGGGAVGTRKALTDIAERIGAPVLSTNAGKGILPESHPLSLGASIVQEGEPTGTGRRRRGVAGWLGSLGRRPLPVVETRNIGRPHSDRHRSDGTDIGVFRGGAHSGRRPCRNACPVVGTLEPEAVRRSGRKAS